MASCPQQSANVSCGVGFDSSTLVAAGAQGAVKVPANGALESSWNSPSYSPDGSWSRGQTGVGYGILRPGFNVHYVRSNTYLANLDTTEQVHATPSLQAQSVRTSADTINYVNTGGGANFSGDQPFPT